MEVVITPDKSRHGLKSEIKTDCHHLEINSKGRCAGCGAHHILQPDKGIIDLKHLFGHIARGLNIKLKEEKNGGDKDRS